eukprot:gb/GECG01016202.1/.p1 GENE.gb/GECG01016202.1/~~gb/GECG01016202.1/.p1  ORF type:complete len:720 (+),score=76.27 gb/GECG01016202.1/:1-2160(+)
MEEHNSSITSWTQLTSGPPPSSNSGDEKFTVRLNIGPRSDGSDVEGGDEPNAPVSPEHHPSGGNMNLTAYPESLEKYQNSRVPYLTEHEQRTSVVGLREDWDDWPESLIEADTEDNRMCFLSRPAVRKFLQKFINEARRLQGWEFFDMPVNTSDFDDYPSYVKRPVCFDDLDRELDHLQSNGLDMHPPRPNPPQSIGYTNGRGGRLYLRTVRDFLHAWNQVWVNCHLYTSDPNAPVRQYAYVISKRMKERWERHYQHRVIKQRCDGDENDYCVSCGSGGIAEDGSNNIVFCGSDRRGCGKPFHQLCLGGCGMVVPQADWLCDECVECGVPKYSTGCLSPPEVRIRLEATGEQIKYRRLLLSSNLKFEECDQSKLEYPLIESTRGLPTRRIWTEDFGHIDVETQPNGALVGLNVKVDYYRVRYTRPQLGWVTTDTQFSRLSKEDQAQALVSTVRLSFPLSDEDLKQENLNAIERNLNATKKRNEELLEEAKKNGRETPKIHPEIFEFSDDVSIVNIIRACGPHDSPEWICYNITHVCGPCFKLNLVKPGALSRRVRKLVELGRSDELPIFGRHVGHEEVARMLHIHDPAIFRAQQEAEGMRKHERRQQDVPHHRSARSGYREEGPPRKSSRLTPYGSSERSGFPFPVIDESTNPSDFVRHAHSRSDSYRNKPQGLPNNFWKDLTLFEKFTVLPLDSDESKLASAMRSLYDTNSAEGSTIV